MEVKTLMLLQIMLTQKSYILTHQKPQQLLLSSICTTKIHLISSHFHFALYSVNRPAPPLLFGEGAGG